MKGELITTKQEWQKHTVALCGVWDCHNLLRFDWCLRWVKPSRNNGNYPYRIAICSSHNDLPVNRYDDERITALEKAQVKGVEAL